MRSCFLRNFVFFHTLCHLSAVSLTVLDYIIGIRLGKKTTSWCSGCYPHGLVENDSHVLPEKRHVVL